MEKHYVYSARTTEGAEILAPRRGLEPLTLRLTAACSTVELSGNGLWLPSQDSNLG